ncbi:MAG: hypothetical protein ACOCRK_06045 [bacterium]
MIYNFFIYLLISVPEQFLIIYFVTSKYNKWNKLFKEDKQILIGVTFIFCLFYFPLADLKIHYQLFLMIPFIFNVILIVNLMSNYYNIGILDTVKTVVEIYMVKTIFFFISTAAILLLQKNIYTTTIVISCWLIYFPLLLVYIFFKRKQK